MRENRGLVYLALFLAVTALLYARSLNYGPVNWDDQLLRIEYWGENTDPGELLKVFKPKLSGTYQPVRELAMALLAGQGEKSSWWPYHLVSLVFYLATVLFFYLTVSLLLSRLNKFSDQEARLWGVVAATGFFALHPGHVEVAAWILGQKDALVGFFYLGAFFFYARRPAPSRGDLIFSLIFYYLALGSKPSAASLPFVLFFYDRIFRPGLFKPPYLGRLAAVYSLFMLPALPFFYYFLFHTTILTGKLGFDNPLLQLGKVCGAVSFSSLKLLLPLNLCLRYPAFRFESLSDPTLYLYPAFALFILYWAVSAYRKRKPYAFFILWALLALLPNSNLVPIRIERADRYYYLSSIGFCGLAGYWAAYIRSLSPRPFLPFIKAFIVLALACLAGLTYRQIAYWRDSPTAWGRVVSIYPDLTLGRVSLGKSYLKLGEYDQALEEYRPLLEQPVPNTEALKGAVRISLERGQKEKALDFSLVGHRLLPKDEFFLQALTILYLEEKNKERAENLILEWLEILPDSRRGWLMLVKLRSVQGRPAEAARALEQLIRIDPNDVEAYNGLAMLCAETGERQRAEGYLRQALDREPDSRLTWMNLAYLYSNTGRREEAVGIYSRYSLEALDLRGLEFMGALFFERGENERSLQFFLEMANRQPTLAKAFNNAGVVCERMGQYREADSMYLHALALDSSYVDAFYNRGNLLFALGDRKSALHHYQLADSLAGGADRDIVKSLANTFSVLGDTAQARMSAERLRRLDSSKKKD
ncbi:MAG TPA: tetratricopeptide repeat protein [archaeon]|nr:tetratricopeptide repeat protein [archaeon]